MPIQRHRRLQPQRVPRAQPAGHNPELLARRQHLAPNARARRLIRRHINLEPVLARIPGSRDQHVMQSRTPAPT